ncbi:MAG TPA: Rha family transcriptional regulator [Burkholderiales bacterium]|nr:Rha family transcriptional regulator [Burkholderiales bacterium]
MSNTPDHKVILFNNQTITIDPKQRLISVNVLECYNIAIFEIGYTYGPTAFVKIDEQTYVKEKYLREFCEEFGRQYIDVFNLRTNVETMSSLEIAQLTGKRHDHVLRDIENMISELENALTPNLGLMYRTVTYDVKAGFGTRKEKMYELNEELTLTLTSGYSIIQRHAIIREWQAHRRGELIDYQPQTIPPTTPHLQIERPQTSKPRNAAFLQTTIKQIDSLQISAESRQVLKAHLLHEQAGLPLELMLPVIRDEKLSPAQIALRMNVSAQAVGHIISKLGIRGNQNYSEARLSHSERSKKDVVVHFYNNQAVNMIQQALKDKQNEKKN